MKVKLKLHKEIEIDLEDYKEPILSWWNYHLQKDEEEATELDELTKADIKEAFNSFLEGDINSFDFDIDETDITVEVLP